MTGKRKWVIVAVVTILVVALAVGVPLRYMERRQAIFEDVFIHYSFRMESARGSWVPDPFDEVSVEGFVVTLLTHVEYVTEFPPKEEQWVNVIYLRPDNWYYIPGDDYAVLGTQSQINKLNKIITADPGIMISDRLVLPLTEEQLLSRPDAVLEIVKQLDKEQWDYFHRGFYMPTVEICARSAGIEVPTE